MTIAQLFRACVIALVVTTFTVGCSKQEPARHAVESVDAALTAVSEQAQKYQPDQLAALQVRVTSLKASFDKGDYKQVLADAPTLLNDTQALGANAAARKDQAMKTLAAQWASLCAPLPDRVAAVQDRIDNLSKDKKAAAKVDLPAAKARMADVDALWAKAQESFTAGDLEAAVNAAKEVQSKTAAAAASLKLTLSP